MILVDFLEIAHWEPAGENVNFRTGDVIYLSRELTKPFHLVAQKVYEWDLHMVCHHPEKFGDHRHSSKT